jgi:uncharacterized protein (DUF486 family)
MRSPAAACRLTRKLSWQSFDIKPLLIRKIPMLSFPKFSAVAPVVMLVLSNVFMTFAWYGHLKYKSSALFLAIVASWGIAFFEYCLAVPANRVGSAYYSTAQLKTMQEVITLIVFAGFSIFWLKESLTINHAIGFALIAIGASFIFRS